MQIYTTTKWCSKKENCLRHKAEIAQAMLNEMNLRLHFWADAIYTAIQIISGCQIANVHLKTPEEKWSGRKPNFSHLKIFGCVCYVHVLRTKLDSKSEKCIFIGYTKEQKGYRCYNPNTKDLKVSRDVVF